MKTLEQSEALEATPLSGDDSFVEPKTSDKSLQMRIVDPVNDPGWDHVVALHRDAGCFHTSAWAKVLQQTYDHQPFYLQFSCRRRLAALIPLMEVRSLFTGRRGVCVPFSDTCEPLIFDAEAMGFVKDRLLRIGFGCLEKLQGLAYTNAPAPVTSGTLRTTYSNCSSANSGNEE